MPFIDIEWKDGQDNMPGTVGDVKFIPTSQADISGVTVDDDGVTLLGDIAIKSGGRINNIYATDRSGNATDENQGDIDGSYSENTLTWMIPGSFKDQESYKRKVRNTRGIYLFRDSDFNWRVIGIWAAQNPKYTEGGEEPMYIASLEKPAYTAPSGTQGASGGDRRGATITVTSDAPHGALFYDGDIPVNPPPPA